MLGDGQFAVADRWEAAGRLALVGIGVEPGLSDVFARYAADHLFSTVDEVGVRDGANLEIEGFDFAPDVLDLDDDRGVPQPAGDLGARPRLVHHRAVLRARDVRVPRAASGRSSASTSSTKRSCSIPRWVDCNRVTFKYGLGDEFIAVLEALHKTGLDRTDTVRVRGVEVSPRDVVAATLPNPAELGDRMHGKTCAGTWVTGTGTDGNPREVYLHHVVDNDWCMAEYGHQAVVWQTAINPVIALELARPRDVVGRRRARPRGVRRGPLPGPAHRVRLAVGHRGAHTRRRDAAPARASGDVARSSGRCGSRRARRAALAARRPRGSSPRRASLERHAIAPISAGTPKATKPAAIARPPSQP